jgi:unsaturated rhamnogalacturonyl hydrolase
MAWGINHGLLDRQQYLPVVNNAWKGLLGCVHADGKLGYVQPVGASPKPATADMTHEYGSGAFLLAGSEMARLEGAR